MLCKYYAGIRLPRNMFEVPWIGTLAYYFNVSEKIDSVLHKSKRENFKRIGGLYSQWFAASKTVG